MGAVAPVVDARPVSAGVIRLRYPGTCARCARPLPAGTQARWDRKTRAATCAVCLADEGVAPIERGTAGGSAAREWERRHDRREAQVRARFGRLAGVALAITQDPETTQAWLHGATGERLLGSVLDPLCDGGMVVLHDRRIPRSRANIDHIVVSRAGVFVIDAKNYRGRVERRDRGGWFSVDYRLYVGGRDKSNLVTGMARQVEAVRVALGADFAGLPITQALCFVDADWSLFARPLRFGDVHVLWPKALLELLRADGPLTPDVIVSVERRLTLALPPA
jgi:hypothetical protein